MKKLLTKFQPSSTSLPSESQPTNASAGALHYRQHSTLSTAYNGTKLILGVVKESADIFPPLKSVFGGLTTLLKHYDQYITNKGDVKRLIDRVDKLGESLAQPPRKGNSQEIERRRILARKLQGVLAILRPLVEQGSASGFFSNVDQAAEIADIVEEIRDTVIDYQTSLQQSLNDQVMSLTEIVLLDRLPRASGAGFDSSNCPKHLQDTQVQILSTIETWLWDNSHHQVYWLNGDAGAGKTTILQNVAGRLFADGLLGASFFCSSNVPHRRESRFIFPTLAFQLAYTYPDFRSYLVQILTANPDVGHESLPNQLNKLLIEPLRETGLSTVIVIDALDECEETQPVSTVLSVLSLELARIPRVKFFIASRPESQIWSGFQLSRLRAHVNILQLQGVNRADINGGVEMTMQASSSRNAPYVVGLHEGVQVTTVGFSKEENGHLFFDAVSNKWAKIMVNGRRSSEVLLSHGGSHWIECCKAEISELSSLQAADLLYGLYIVAFHQHGLVRTISLTTEGSARSVYNVLSKNWAKVLFDRGQDKLLSSYGISTLTLKCQEAVQELNRNHGILPLQTAQFIVAYHQSRHVSVIGFSHQAASQAVYDAIPNEWAKILTNRTSNKCLESHGMAFYLNQCEEKIQRLVSQSQLMM